MTPTETTSIVVAAESTPMSEIDALDLTNRIGTTVDDLWSLVLEAHEQEAWKALGYTSWAAYVTDQLPISRRHANRLVAQGEVIRAVRSAVGPTGPTDLAVTEREARDIRPRLDDVVHDIKARIGRGAAPRTAVTEAVAEARAPQAGPFDDEDDDVPTELDIADMLVRIVGDRLETASDQTRHEWLVAVQLADVVRDWAVSTAPNFYFFTQVATVLYTRTTPLEVWAVFAPWLVATATQSIEEFSALRVGRRSDGRVVGEDLARVTIALWGTPVDDDMRLTMFKAMETTIAMAVVDAEGLVRYTRVAEVAEVALIDSRWSFSEQSRRLIASKDYRAVVSDDR